MSCEASIECPACKGDGRDLNNLDAETAGEGGDWVDCSPKCPTCFGETVVPANEHERNLWTLACQVADAAKYERNPEAKRLLQEASVLLDNVALIAARSEAA